MVEALIRTTKAILETRPIYHKCDATIRGHVFCSCLALLLKAELEKRLAARGEAWEWVEVLRGLDNLQEVAAVFRGRHYVCAASSLARPTPPSVQPASLFRLPFRKGSVPT